VDGLVLPKKTVPLIESLTSIQNSSFLLNVRKSKMIRQQCRPLDL
jgi:hypothetical protein